MKRLSRGPGLTRSMLILFGLWTNLTLACNEAAVDPLAGDTSTNTGSAVRTDPSVNQPSKRGEAGGDSVDMESKSASASSILTSVLTSDSAVSAAAENGPGTGQELATSTVAATHTQASSKISTSIGTSDQSHAVDDGADVGSHAGASDVDDASELSNDLVLTSINPAWGAVGGATSITLHGSGFRSDMTVKIGQDACRSLVIASSDTATCLTPPGAAGTVSVSVAGAEGGSSATVDYTYFSPLQMSAVSALEVGAGAQLAPSGGVPPYRFTADVGTISELGYYNAAHTPGTAQVQVSDKAGNVFSTSIIVDPEFTVTPNTIDLAVGNIFDFVPSGGRAPYVTAISDPIGGTLAGNRYTAGGVPGNYSISITDTLGRQKSISVAVRPALSVTPATLSLAVANTAALTATGGVPPYSYHATLGSINSSGLYTAPASSGVDAVTIVDARGNQIQATVTINAALSISPTSTSLLVNTQKSFTASGGVPPYSFQANVGSVSPTGTYLAPATAGSATISVHDSVGNSHSASITIVPTFSVTPTAATIVLNGFADFAAQGGVPPYTATKVSNNTLGYLFGNSATGSFTFSALINEALLGTDTLRIADAAGHTIDVTVTVNHPNTALLGNRNVVIGQERNFTISGGLPPYTVTASGGTILSNGKYTAQAQGVYTITVVDSQPTTRSFQVGAHHLPTFTGPDQVKVGSSISLSAAMGSGAYTYTMVSGVGSLTNAVVPANVATDQLSGSVTYTAPSAPGTAVIRLADGDGNIVEKTIHVVEDPLDTSFGTLGFAGLPSGVSLAQIHKVRVLADGKILALGSTTTNMPTLLRYDQHGQIDPAFASNGYIDLSSFFSSSGAFSNELLIAADGSIFLAGLTQNHAVCTYSSVAKSYPFIIKITSSGVVDTSFATNGMGQYCQTPAMPRSVCSLAATIAQSGKIYLAGVDCSAAIGAGTIVMRVLASGALDSTYNGTGRILPPLVNSNQSGDVAGVFESNLGAIMVAGTVDRFLTTASYALVKHDPVNPVSSFGTNGVGKITVGKRDVTLGLRAAIDHSGRLVIGDSKSTGVGQARISVARFTATGVADSSFGTNGLSEISPCPVGVSAYLSHLMVQSDNKIFGSAACNATTSGGWHVLFRYDSSGALDAAFGIDGVLQFFGTSLMYPRHFETDLNGRFVIGGSRSTGGGSQAPYLIRLLP